MVAETWQQECAGIYTLLAGQLPNGQPVWGNRSGDRWLYYNTDGNWTIGGASEWENNFNCNNGYLLNMSPNAPGTLPHQLQGSWTLFDGTEWRQDPDVAVCECEDAPSSEGAAVEAIATSAVNVTDPTTHPGGADAAEALSSSASQSGSDVDVAGLLAGEASPEAAVAQPGRVASDWAGESPREGSNAPSAAEAAADAADTAGAGAAEAEPSAPPSTRSSQAGAAGQLRQTPRAGAVVHQPQAQKSPHQKLADAAAPAAAAPASGLRAPEDEAVASQRVLPSEVKLRERLKVAQERLAGATARAAAAAEAERKAHKEVSDVKGLAAAAAERARAGRARLAALRQAAKAASASAGRIERELLPAARAEETTLQEQAAELRVAACLTRLLKDPTPLNAAAVQGLSDQELLRVLVGVAQRKRKASAMTCNTGDHVVDQLSQLDESAEELGKEEAEMQALCEALSHQTQAKACDEAAFRVSLNRLRRRIALLSEVLNALTVAQGKVAPILAPSSRPPGDHGVLASLKHLLGARSDRRLGLAQAVAAWSAEVHALRTQYQRETMARHVQLRQELRRLQEDLTAVVIARVYAEEAKEAADAERIDASTEQRRRLARQSLELRQSLCLELAAKNSKPLAASPQRPPPQGGSFQLEADSLATRRSGRSFGKSASATQLQRRLR